MDKKRRVAGKGKYSSVGENQRETERQFNNNLHISKEIRNAYAHSVSAVVIKLPCILKEGDKIPPAILKEGKAYKLLGTDRNENTAHYGCESTKESIDRQSMNRDYFLSEVGKAYTENRDAISITALLPVIAGDVIFQYFDNKSIDAAYKLIHFSYLNRTFEFKKCPRSEVKEANLPLISAGMQEIKKTSDPENDQEASEEKRKATEHDRLRQKVNAEYITQYCINSYQRKLANITFQLPKLISRSDKFPKFLNLARTGFSYQFVSINYEKNELTYKLAPTDLSDQMNLPHAPHFGDDDIGKRFGGVN